MRCHCCGAEMEKVKTNLPFKLTGQTILVVEDIPVVQCQNCPEYLLEDEVMEKIDQMISELDENVELEIIPFAA